MGVESLVINVVAQLDATGEFEVFTFDLFPLVPAEATLHLEESGLPKIGTRIEKGMVIVGLIGKSESFDLDNRPTALEIHGEGRDHVCKKYGHMWVDRSTYANDQQTGVVSAARIENCEGGFVAIVEIEPQPK